MVRLRGAEAAVAAFADSLPSVQPAAKQRGVLVAEIAPARTLAGA
ncbi:hypothetical protein ACWDLG_41495 [Nonomuraea sp. NPDC003727]